MKLKAMLLFLFLFGSINAQNLVLNPSFEAYINCPIVIGSFNRDVQNWSTPNSGSTDYYNSCKTERGLKGLENYNGSQKARTGKGYAGIYVFTDDNYREYVQGELKLRLVKGEEYIVSFYVSLAKKSTHSILNLSVLFTEEELSKCYHSNWCEKYIRPKRVTSKSFTLIKNNKNVYYQQTEDWIKVSFSFFSNGFENYFSIGNFKSNSKTKKKQIKKNIKPKFSYYYIDDVSVENIDNDSIIEKPSEVKK
ncbi:hypothetical protein [Lacinutrix jangbogonensis]|uniref:hypothetical protein n=1 Tax=Lacinutrix jangbogonensis TaxID=1469557 RepID=UPI00053E85F0|nr:hypothetical protein [Lacinutrix jangbogonensis]